jgi:crotonobetainyl-CoA:carnitine CoA-transferase CaiB-like acyl-CoA transferase
LGADFVERSAGASLVLFAAGRTADAERGDEFLADLDHDRALGQQHVWLLEDDLRRRCRFCALDEDAAVLKAFAGRGIVCGAVLDTAEVLADPRLRERETIFDLEHPTRGRFSVIGCPVRLSESPVAARPAPLRGEHTEDVLRSLAGYTREEIQQLREKQVI